MRPPLSKKAPSPAGAGSQRAKEPHKSPQNTAGLATYIADMTAELARLAGDAGMPMLCYFLNLARVEADLLARHAPPADKH